MAIVTNTFQSHTAIGNTIREDLYDTITDISPLDTPLLSMIGRTTATSTKHEWLEDSLAAVATTAGLEGDEFSATAAAVPTRHVNYTQILRKDFLVSGSNEAALHAGMSSQIGYQGRKALEELARNTEATLIQGVKTVTTVLGDTNDARKMDGLSAFAGNTTTALGTVASVTEASMAALLELIWDDGVMADTVLANSHLKKEFSAYTTVTRIHHDGGVNDPRAVVRNVEMYESDFGTVNVFLERYVNAGDIGYAFNKSYLNVAIFRPTRLERLAKTGDAEKIMVLHELTLEVLAPDAVGIFSIA